jgi:hypothetical protein
MVEQMIKIPSESIFYSFIKKYAADIKEVIRDEGPEYYMGEEIVAKVTHELEESHYYAKEQIISDVQIQRQEPLSSTEIDFINEALQGNCVYAVGIMGMVKTPTKTIYEEAKSRGLTSIEAKDFMIQRTHVIPKEQFISA